MNDQELATLEEKVEVEPNSTPLASDSSADESETGQAVAAESDQSPAEATPAASIDPEEMTSSEPKDAPAEPSGAVEVTTEDSTPEPSEDSDASGTSESPDGLSIHNLKVGQHLVGTVKNITDFGAFVDVGIPQDGLIHISKLSKQKVDKVSDVLSQGQEVEVWVKKVDKKRGRLSLTMIKPVARRLRDIEEGMELEGTVTRLESYGAFVDIGSDRDGLVHISQISHGYIKHPEEALTVGDKIKVQVLKVNRKKRQVDLSIKALVPPPPPEVEEIPEETKTVRDRPAAARSDRTKPANGRSESQKVETETAESDEPVVTAMAVAYAALQNRQQQDEEEKDEDSAKDKSRSKTEIDDIVARTLASRK